MSVGFVLGWISTEFKSVRLGATASPMRLIWLGYMALNHQITFLIQAWKHILNCSAQHAFPTLYQSVLKYAALRAAEGTPTLKLRKYKALSY